LGFHELYAKIISIKTIKHLKYFNWCAMNLKYMKVYFFEKDLYIKKYVLYSVNVSCYTHSYYIVVIMHLLKISSYSKRVYDFG